MNSPASHSASWRAACILLGMASLIAANAANGIPGYLTDSEGKVVHSGFGDCVHTGFWTPDMAIPGCDGYQKQAAAEPVSLARFEPVVLNERVLFDFDKSELRPEGMRILDDLAQRLQSYTTFTSVIVSGHADRIGTEEYNEDLSRRRAQTVANYLVGHSQINTAKFEVRALGETQPIKDCTDVTAREPLIECLQPNRRTEVDIEGGPENR